MLVYTRMLFAQFAEYSVQIANKAGLPKKSVNRLPRAVILNLFRSRAPRCNSSSTLYA
jgi:hypothetical protein